MGRRNIQFLKLGNTNSSIFILGRQQGVAFKRQAAKRFPAVKQINAHRQPFRAALATQRCFIRI